MMNIRSTLLILLLLTSITYDLQAQSPYELSWPQDGILLIAGIPFLYFGFRYDRSVYPLQSDEVTNLNRTDINAFDRIATYQYSEKAAHLSDILVYTCLASPLTLLFSRDIQRDAGKVYTMYGESLIYGLALPFYSKGGITRFRPYVYNPNVNNQVKLTSDARKSFFSGHTSLAFTSMVFFASVYSGYYPDSQWKPYIWTGSILLASSVGYLRVAAGAHYPTDAIVGALVGIAIGYIIPKIHETDRKTASFESQNSDYRKTFFNVNFVF